ncbi:hypothetical protein BD310DRAFT_779632, partial [Dichomitus squalens]
AYTHLVLRRSLSSRSPTPPSNKKARKHDTHKPRRHASRDRHQQDDPHRHRREGDRARERGRSRDRDPQLGSAERGQHPDMRRPVLGKTSRPPQNWVDDWLAQEEAELAEDPEANQPPVVDFTQPRPQPSANASRPPRLVPRHP